MTNPLVPQGTLNRLRGSFSCINLPQLNVTNSFLGKEGISLAFEGEASGYFTTLTGAVPSPSPYVIGSVTLHLLRTQALSDTWKQQMELNTSIGDCVVTTDASTLSDFQLSNATIKNPSELAFNGEGPDFVIQVQGIYYINSSLFNAA